MQLQVLSCLRLLLLVLLVLPPPPRPSMGYLCFPAGFMLVGCKRSCKVCTPAKTKTNTGHVTDVPIKTA